MTGLNKWQVGRAAAVGGVAAYSKLAVLFKGGGAAKLAAAGVAVAGAVAVTGDGKPSPAKKR